MTELDELSGAAGDGYEPRPGLTHRDADWSGLRVLVAGLGISGFAAADALWVNRMKRQTPRAGTTPAGPCKPA